MSPTPTDTPAGADLGSQVARLHHTLGRWARSDAGAHAELRRSVPGQIPAIGLWKLLVQCDIDPRTEAEERGWALLAWTLASLGGTESRQPIGRALQGAGLSELRLVRLLRADAGQLPDALTAAVRQIMAKGGNGDALQLARLVLTGPDSEAGERIRRQIAKDYYRAERTTA